MILSAFARHTISMKKKNDFAKDTGATKDIYKYDDADLGE